MKPRRRLRHNRNIIIEKQEFCYFPVLSYITRDLETHARFNF